MLLPLPHLGSRPQRARVLQLTQQVLLLAPQTRESARRPLLLLLLRAPARLPRARARRN